MKTCRGFSLIEVTLAIGVVSFALLSVVALLPTGLKTVKNANEQAGAANVIGTLANSLLQAREAPGQSGKFFGGPSSETKVLYELGGPEVTHDWNNLRLDGYAETPLQQKRLTARLVIAPPATNAAGAVVTNGRATISVAWSALGNPRWDNENRRWQGAEGSLTTALVFHPVR